MKNQAGVQHCRENHPKPEDALLLVRRGRCSLCDCMRTVGCLHDSICAPSRPLSVIPERAYLTRPVACLSGKLPPVLSSLPMFRHLFAARLSSAELAREPASSFPVLLERAGMSINSTWRSAIASSSCRGKLKI